MAVEPGCAACCRTNLVKERRVALWSARNRIRRVGTKALFRDRKPHFVPVLPNLYVNRIYYSVVYQSSLASLVLSGWLRRMNLVGVPRDRRDFSSTCYYNLNDRIERLH